MQYEFFNHPLWQQTATALAHSLWQGGVVAVAYLAAVRFLSNRPDRRYVAGVTALLAMVAGFVATVAIAEPLTVLKSALAMSTGDTSDAAPEVTALLAAIANAGIIDESFATSEPVDALRYDGWGVAIQWMTIAWCTGVVLLSLRLLAGFIGLRRFYRQSSDVPDDLLKAALRMAQALGLRHVPKLVVSSRVAEAIAFGFLRPVIVFPAAWLSELPPNVIEAVLAHELAHIRRYDLWVNLFQRVAETLLFFHPAVWWISRQVRVDREMCCDELAVAATQQRLAYVSALEVVARRTFGVSGLTLATGIGGRKMQLLERVRNVLGMPPTRRNGAWWPAGLLALAVPFGLWYLSLTAAEAVGSSDEKNPLVAAGQLADDEEKEPQGNAFVAGLVEELLVSDLRHELATVEDGQVLAQIETAQQDLLMAQERLAEEVRRANKTPDPAEIQRMEAELQKRRAELEMEAARLDQLRAALKERHQKRTASEALFDSLNPFRVSERAEQERDIAEAKAREAAMVARRELESRLQSIHRELEDALRTAEKRGDKEAMAKVREKIEHVHDQARQEIKTLERKLAKLESQAQDGIGKLSKKPGPEELRAVAEKLHRQIAEQHAQIEEKLKWAMESKQFDQVERLRGHQQELHAKAARMMDELKRHPESVLQLAEQLDAQSFKENSKKPIRHKVELDAPGSRDEELLHVIRELRDEVRGLRDEVRELRGKRDSPKGKKADGDEAALPNKKSSDAAIRADDGTVLDPAAELKYAESIGGRPNFSKLKQAIDAQADKSAEVEERDKQRDQPLNPVQPANDSQPGNKPPL